MVVVVMMVVEEEEVCHAYLPPPESSPTLHVSTCKSSSVSPSHASPRKTITPPLLLPPSSLDCPCDVPPFFKRASRCVPVLTCVACSCTWPALIRLQFHLGTGLLDRPLRLYHVRLCSKQKTGYNFWLQIHTLDVPVVVAP